MSVIFQVLSTAVLSFICLSVGILTTWPSSTLILFTSPNTTLNRVMTETEVSLLGSLSCISGIIAIPFAGYVMDSLGRKWSCIVLNLVQIACWVIVSTCTTVEAILLAMFLSGSRNCMFIVVPICISEFSEDSIRGSMVSSAILSYGLGMLVSYLMGGLLDYNTMNYVGLSVAVMGLILLGTVKESPLHLLKIGREREARRSIAFYRNVKITSKVVDEEIEKIRRFLNSEIETKIDEKLALNVQEVATTKNFQWQCLKKSRTAQRGLLVSIVLYTASVFQGLIVVQMYAGLFFTQALPSISATVASVLFALVNSIASLIATYFMDRLGRRSLMIYGSIGTGLCSAIFGSQIHGNWGPNWLTAVFVFLYSLTYTIGAGTVPYVIGAEIFMPEIKSLASMIALEWTLLCNFIVLFTFNPVVNSVGLGPVFYIFSICSFLSALYCFYYLPETSGLAVDDIQERLKRPRNNKM